MGGLSITAENVSSGSFTDRQLSDFAGYPVVALHMPDLPHWKLVRDNGHLNERALRKAFGSELAERADAISDRLKRLDGAFSGMNTQSLAEVRYPAVKSFRLETNLPSVPPTIDFRREAMDYWHDIETRGIDRVTDCENTRFFGPKPGKTMPYVFPGVLSEPVTPFVKARWEQIFKNTAAVMLVNANDGADEFKKVWALELGLPPDRVTRLPDPKIHHLISMGHEAQHLRQVTFSAVDTRIADYNYKLNYFIPKYYEEADADLAIRSQLRRTHFGAKDKIDEALTMDRHKRYMGLFFNEPWYWTAPFMDAVESRDKRPSFYQVHQSVMEIRLRIMAEAERLQSLRDGRVLPPAITGKELNDLVAAWREYPGAPRTVADQGKSIFGVGLRPEWMSYEDVTKNNDKKGIIPGIDDLFIIWRGRQFYDKPEIFYTLLKKSLNAGAFEANPLSQKIAAKMVDAAEYFDPRLTAMPDVAASIQLPQRGYHSYKLQQIARGASVPETADALPISGMVRGDVYVPQRAPQVAAVLQP